MGFIAAKSPTYFAPAEFAMLDANGKLVISKFDCQFKRMTKDEIEALHVELEKAPDPDRHLIESVQVGWRAVEEADGTDMAFGMGACDRLENEFPGFRKACVASWFRSQNPTAAAHLAEKN